MDARTVLHFASEGILGGKNSPDGVSPFIPHKFSFQDRLEYHRRLREAKERTHAELENEITNASIENRKGLDPVAFLLKRLEVREREVRCEFGQSNMPSRRSTRARTPTED